MLEHPTIIEHTNKMKSSVPPGKPLEDSGREISATKLFHELAHKRICVVIPAYNEETQIGKVLETLPDYINHILVVDDASTDNTSAVVKKKIAQRGEITLIRHTENQGCGGALATGYRWALDMEFDIIVRMDGDGQMNPEDLTAILTPILRGETDYAKGNRFFSGQAFQSMPRLRYYGTAFLSLLTKIVSGYWHISDFQSGYTAITREALLSIDLDSMYKRYGQPNDLLVLLNISNNRVTDIPVKPIYNIGEKSGIKIKKVIFTISWLLFKRFFWRMKEKYVIRDFHPLVFFYLLGIMFGGVTVILFTRLFYTWMTTSHIPAINALAAMFSFISSSQFTLFAMWFDMEANKDLKK